jgi:hypothetical protein
MPTFACPGCARVIAVEPHESHLVIECARCHARFVVGTQALPVPPTDPMEDLWHRPPRPLPRRSRGDVLIYLSLFASGVVAALCLACVR